MVYNNSIYAPGGTGVTIDSGSNGAIVRNNIVFGQKDSAGAIVDQGMASMLANNFISDPLFTDAGAGNFRLQAGSGAIDHGGSLPEVPDDFDGTARPRGAGYDCGAFER